MKPIDFKSLPPALFAAGVIAAINIVYTVSFAALLFNGLLIGYFRLGVSIILFSYAISSVVMAAGSSLPGLIVTPKGAITAVISVVATSIVASSTPPLDAPTALASLLTCTAVSTFLAGAVFFLLGVFRAGNLIRFIPFPVLGGYFGGVGIILISGSMAIMTGHAISLADLPRLIERENAILWLPGLAFALAGRLAARRFSHFLTLPLFIMAGALVFFAAAAATGTSVAELRAIGFLMPTVSDGFDLPRLLPQFAAGASWPVVAAQWGHMLSIVLIGSLSVLLYISLTEVGTGSEINLERDLKVVGAANLLTAAIGGFVSFHEPVDTKLAHGLGGPNRIVGFFFGGLCLLFALGGGYAVGYFPKPIMGGLILLIGIDLLADNVCKGRRRLPTSEFALVLLIIVAVALLGFLKGIGVGILVAIMLFVINYSRIDVVRSRLSGRIYHSKVERSPAELAVLNRTGHRLQLFVLQGYIFFGTAERLLLRVRATLRHNATPAQPRAANYVVLDFRLVDNIDSSALHAFSKLLKTAERENSHLVLTDLNAPTARQFEAIDFFNAARAVRLEHLDYGLEWCEERLLAAAIPAAPVPMAIDGWLGEILQDPEGAAVFKTFLVPMALADGEVLFRANDPSDCLYFVESGRLSILLPQSGGGRLRLRTMGAGTVIGEIGLYADRPRSADAVADRPSTLYRLSYRHFNALERQFPNIARQFHKYVVLSLSRRMARDSEAMQVLLP